LYLNLNYGRHRKWSRGVSSFVDIVNFGEYQLNTGTKYNSSRERSVLEKITLDVVNFIKKEIEQAAV
jgi:adenylate kinase